MITKKQQGMNAFTGYFLNNCFSGETRKEIRAYFTDGTEGVYTTASFELLKSDRSVLHIIDNETGEIIYYKN